jgi:addiction module RelE/StbE family toxin
MVQIKWTEQAVSDLREIALYISRDSKKYAKIQVQKIKERTQILKKNTHAGQIVTFFNLKEIRQLVVGAYIIIYRIINESQVDILTIHHSSRDLNLRDLDI